LPCVIQYFVELLFAFDVTSVLVSGLRPSTAYKMIVYAENGVTAVSGTIRASDIDIITDVAGAFSFHVCFIIPRRSFLSELLD